jgi:hypothetical protein
MLPSSCFVLDLFEIFKEKNEETRRNSNGTGME